jgi:uncharacterized protein
LAVLIDTSALFALLDEDDVHHARSRRTLGALKGSTHEIVVHSFALNECIALLQSRLGLAAVRTFASTIAPILSVVWVDAELYERGLSAMLASGRRTVSLVDHVSFIVMRDRQVRTAFAFDRDFADQGFEVLGA